jgi:hypothetical protein
MRGYVFVQAAGISTVKCLTSWIDKALNYNPRAKASKTTKKESRQNRYAQKQENERIMKRRIFAILARDSASVR